MFVLNVFASFLYLITLLLLDDTLSSDVVAIVAIAVACLGFSFHLMPVVAVVFVVVRDFLLILCVFSRSIPQTEAV